MRAAVLTVSDGVAAGAREDASGDVLEELLSGEGYDVVRRVVPDDRAEIARAIRELASAAPLVLTTGGTGLAPRDVTPEATLKVCERVIPGFGELMRAVSLRSVPTAILSRQTAGIRGRCLIINLPGKPAAIRECLLAVFPAVPYCVDLLDGPSLTTNEAVVQAFRPKK